MTNHHRINSVLAAVVTSVLALGAASASAMPVGAGSTYRYAPPAQLSVHAPSQPSHGPVACGDVCSSHGYQIVSGVPSLTTHATSGGGFDWGDASIGAAGGLALSLLGLGGMMAISQRRTRRGESALTS